MNRWWSLAVAALVPGGLIALAVLSLVRLRRRWLARDRVVIDALIAERGHTYRFTGHDEALEQHTQTRRKLAEMVKKDGRRIETRDDGEKPIEVPRIYAPWEAEFDPDRSVKIERVN